MVSDIPVVVIAWNNLTFVKNFVNQIQHITNKIIIMDNASTYPPMFEYYDSLEKQDSDKYEIRRFSTNYGHNVCYLFLDTLPDVFCMSDPDLQLNPKMSINAIEHLLHISNTYQAAKVGLALDLSDHDKFIQGPAGPKIYQFELQYWQKRIPSNDYEIYYAPIDTTFLLLNRKYMQHNLHVHIRVAGLFTAKHLPWYDGYIRNNVPKEELNHWTKDNKSSSIINIVGLDSLI
jgi:hypothetical protein